MVHIAPAFFSIKPGQVVQAGEAPTQYQIVSVISLESVLATDLATKKSHRLRIENLVPVSEDEAKVESETPATDAALFSEEEWSIAQTRFEAIKPLLQEPIRSREFVDKIAQEHKVHATTLYKWLRMFQRSQHVASLVPEKSGRKTGVRLLTPEQELVIASAIEERYLTKQRHKKQDVVEEVIRRCRLAKLETPHANTIRKRIDAMNPASVMRRRGFREMAANRFTPILGEFPHAKQPYATVQIDHTIADVILVDEITRKPVGRPWLTLAIDVYSRMVAGVYLSFEQASAASVGMCLAQAICPKREYLASLSVVGDWPVWGVMGTVHCDNAKEFRGSVLSRACEDYAINLQFRPVKQPRYGGTIERLMGTMANEIRKLPGATFSNTTQRREYDSQAESALTLKEFERYLVDFIVNVYHQRLHSELGMSPKRKWELGILGDGTTPGIGIFAKPEDTMRVRLDFMPYFLRSVQPYGIQIDNISYYDGALIPYINMVDPEDGSAKQSFLVRRDPRDISKVYFKDPKDGRYITVPYRNVNLPAMSAWELREVQERLKAEGKSAIDETALFESLARMRAQVDDSLQKTKAARRQATRRPAAASTAVSAKPASAAADEETSTRTRTPIHDIDDNPFAEPAQPFEHTM